MTSSRYDSSLEVNNEKCVVSLVKQSGNRAFRRRGQLGFLIIEQWDEARNSSIACRVDFPFGINKGMHISQIKPPYKQISVSTISSWAVDARTFNTSALGQYVNDTNNHRELAGVESSYRHAAKALKKNLKLTPGNHSADYYYMRAAMPIPTFHATPIRWNPFAGLLGSKPFRFSYLQYSSFRQRMYAGFYIINGGFLNNDLGVLDYLFPFSRLLMPALWAGLPWYISLPIAIPVLISYTVKTITATVLTLAITPIIGIVHALCASCFDPKNDLDQSVTLCPIKEDVESVSDLEPDKDLHGSMPFSHFNTISKQLSLRPLAKKTDQHYEELSSQRSLDNQRETLAFGLYEDEEPTAILDVTEQNLAAIENLRKKNKYQINDYLEEAQLTTPPNLRLATVY